MLGCRDEHALLHQAGGIAHARNVASSGFNFKVIEINSAEDDSGARWRGKQAQSHWRSAVQSDSSTANLGADCLFLDQALIALDI